MKYVISVSFLLLVISGYATNTVTLQPDGAASKDTVIWASYPDDNYGDVPDIWAGMYLGHGDALIEFEGLDTYIGATLTYAELNLYVGTVYDMGYEFWVCRVDGTWDEHTVTWNNNPGHEGTIYETFETPAGDAWLSVDVTAIVQTWLDESFPHYGFYIGLHSGGFGYFFFWSGEYTSNPDLRPYLYLEYSYESIAPASLGAIKAGFTE
ncbi:MAG: DNRLRE domain-containing protein [Candidatus Coatesbacteria bacterium]|nr:MAG: DNRLRE domain-containing protein [Candidatus Coatesbacteria bacterium]